MKTELKLTGMHCEACVARLTEAFQKMPGVRSAHVTLNPPQAHIESDQPLSMELLNQAARSAGDYSVSQTNADSQPPAAPKLPSLFPLFLIVGYILGTTGLITFIRGSGNLHSFLNDFMAGFFLVFSFFKLLDLRGFADAYQSYDIVARKSRLWAFAYPFAELGLGVAYLLRWNPTSTNSATLILMLAGSIGVLQAVLRKNQIRCACLGTVLNLPMTTVTLVEDLGMAAMAAGMLLWRA